MEICRKVRAPALALSAGLLLTGSLAAGPAPSGRLAGVVLDPSGTPQLGATVLVAPEQTGQLAAVQLLTNDHGLFHTGTLLPGGYSVRVTLAGFLPALREHVRVEANRTTLLKVELDSVFTSLDRLRRPANRKAGADDWSWVLRTSASTRPVLRWADGEVVIDGEPSRVEVARQRQPRGRVELTTGARHPGSVSNLAESPAMAFAYEQGLGFASRLLLAGQVSYEHSAAAGFAAAWLPSGEEGKGASTRVVLRQSKLGPEGPVFRGVQLQQDDQVALGDYVSLRYGGEYVLMGLGRPTSSLRPRAELTVGLAPGWRASVIMAARPQTELSSGSGALDSSLEELDALPTLLMRNGRPVLDRAWHEEAAVEHSLGANATLRAAVFRDQSRHTAVFGRGDVPSPDYFQDFFSDAFAYDGGQSSFWGTRVAYRQKISEGLETTVVYSWSGALGTGANATSVDLRDALQTRYCHSLGGRISGHLPHWGTRLATNYRWLSRSTVTRPDFFGDALYEVEPYLNVSVRQPLPSFLCCRIMALADFRNLLAEGYVPVLSRDGYALLIPSVRSFRGGLSFQF